mmetsp:Transcript_118170/g.216560  ORF Transcript_118170/g.216560 Transcript_118170/m.216560 type:complete len:122 (-) Transcript_118170:34-399(-)
MNKPARKLKPAHAALSLRMLSSAAKGPICPAFVAYSRAAVSVAQRTAARKDAGRTLPLTLQILRREPRPRLLDTIMLLWKAMLPRQTTQTRYWLGALPQGRQLRWRTGPARRMPNGDETKK